ncbi:SspB family protein [Notoacmeibacter sp. MSK16QG-6]|uniref:SspB family protein n=1 Tax=Notoacmeibacter sp. MSK16QG-6 TaxID=2957982 RepID=UPI00209D64C3|nr:SspB family protein [Notoacmeibacter sp. MSK16QG-6]MCP1199658.1 SspB family protein [Notoacmeibacter sp. MSK16QG-6]
MTQDQIRYDILAQEALRGVMRKVLTEVTKAGLPGNHHFFITFLTKFPGVRISSRLREKYPEQMTIVLQYQYWDLTVTETGFSVGLSFSDIPEKLEIPYAAVRGFYDPSVNFELEFDVRLDEEASGDAEVTTLPAPAPAVKEVPTAKAPAKSGEPDEKKPARKTKAKESETAENEEAEQKPAADVVSLDAFRKNK